LERIITKPQTSAMTPAWAAAVQRDEEAPGLANDSSPDVADTAAFRSQIVEIDASRLESQRVLRSGASGVVGSSYKMLRTQVLKRLDQLNANTLAILSPTEGAGKTVTAINLAISIAAETGRTALLVDMDLRNPNIHKRFGVRPQIGVEECLESGLPIQNALVKIAGYDRLTLLLAKNRVENSSELLSEQRCATFVEEIRNRYANRIIIFDLPPVLQADDALAFSRHVRSGLMVVGEGRTEREDVLRALDMLRDITVVGTVLNGAREKLQTYY
jgi:protein-tyrosine kinase